jgi:putative inorganic carbon (HCO3(-)) transporter
MRFLIVALIYGAGTVMAARAVVFAACLFLWNDIFQPLEFARDPGAYPVAQYVTGLLLMSFILALVRGRIVLKASAFLILLGVLVAWLGLTTFLSPFREVAMDQFILYLKYLVPIAVIHVALRSKQDIRILSAVLCGSVGVWAAQAGVFCLIHGPREDLGIPGGQMGDRNDFAAAIVGTAPLLVYFLFSKDLKFKIPLRILIAATLVLSLTAVFFSLSRGASVGLGASLMLYVGYVSKTKIRDTILIVAAAGLVLLCLPQSWYDRMNTINVGAEQTEGSAKNRMNLMTGAWNATKDHPVFGLGPGGWLEVAVAYTGDSHNPHSIYLVLSSETGFTGLALYLMVVIFTYVRVSRTINRALKKGDDETARLGSALIMAIFGLLSAMTFLNRPFNEYLWAWMAIANALPVIYDRENAPKRRSASRARPAPAAPAASGLAADAPPEA